MTKIVKRIIILIMGSSFLYALENSYTEHAEKNNWEQREKEVAKFIKEKCKGRALSEYNLEELSYDLSDIWHNTLEYCNYDKIDTRKSILWDQMQDNNCNYYPNNRSSMCKQMQNEYNALHPKQAEALSKATPEYKALEEVFECWDIITKIDRHKSWICYGEKKINELTKERERILNFLTTPSSSHKWEKSRELIEQELANGISFQDLYDKLLHRAKETPEYYAYDNIATQREKAKQDATSEQLSNDGEIRLQLREAHCSFKATIEYRAASWIKKCNKIVRKISELEDALAERENTINDLEVLLKKKNLGKNYA